MDMPRDQRLASRQFRTAGLAIAATAAVALLLAACSVGSSASHSSQRVSPRSTLSWLLTRSALSQLMYDPAVRDVLRASRVYEIVPQGQQPLPGVAAEPVATFTSAAVLERAVAEGQLPAGTYGVLYDPEAWSFTPPAEQRDPVGAAAGAAAVAHAHGLRFIVAPALDLAAVLAPSRGPRWQAFLDLGLVSQMARVADVVELQAQSLERDTATYAAFVQAAASQASAANPSITVLAEVSTNPPGAPVDSRCLTSVIQATRSIVNGYSLSIPRQGPYCPTCDPSRPIIAIQTLTQVG